MDVLSPQVMWIGKRCYRVNPTLELENIGQTDPSNEYLEEDLYNDDEEDDYIIDIIDGGRFRCQLHVPQLFYGQLIGLKGNTRRRIESETKSQVKVPKPGVDGDVVIIGPTRKSVAAGRRRIEAIVLAARNKQQFTHFLSLPFTTDEIRKNFTKFRDEILNGPPVFGLDVSLFQNPKKLHLTLGLMALMDNEDRLTAAQRLQDCRTSIINPIMAEYKNRIVIEMSGVECMNDDASAVEILYAKVQSEPLQRMANSLVAFFVEKGLMQAKFDYVKMHVTLINSIFRDESQMKDGTQNRRTTFDARDILKKYGQFYFGKIELTEIHLSQRYSTSTSDGFYEATGTIKLF